MKSSSYVQITAADVGKAIHTVRRSAGINGFPTCAALLIAGSTLGPHVLSEVWNRISPARGPRRRGVTSLESATTAKFAAAFLSALATFSILNQRHSKPLPSAQSKVLSKDKQSGGRRRSSSVTFGSTVPTDATSIPPLAGRTMDLTTFGIVHASIVLAVSGLHSYRALRAEGHISSLMTSQLEKLSVPLIFVFSSSIIMWTWFYFPDRLPRSYNSWITSAAQLDSRLLEALRQCRFGNFVYGKETGIAPLLGGMARELQYPEEWGDPFKTIPVPCELYHSGSGPTCEWHALARFAQAWQFAFRMYLPLNFLMLLRKHRSKRSTGRALLDASQSSSFLGMFVALFYYGVCLGRTRIGPRLLGKDHVSRQMIDAGVCVGTGCLLCGWSILLEKEPRRPEMSLFVAPRALATILPRRYDRQVRLNP